MPPMLYDADRGVVLLDRHRVRVANADGTELHSVNGYGVGWSPDGTTITYTEYSSYEVDDPGGTYTDYHETKLGYERRRNQPAATHLAL